MPSIPTDTPVLTPHVTSAHLPGQHSPPLGEQPFSAGTINLWPKLLVGVKAQEVGPDLTLCLPRGVEGGGATPVAAEEQSAGGGSKCLRKKRRQRIPASERWGGGRTGLPT